MSLLVRKINLAKWLQVDISQTNDVKADAITNCLKTFKNTLSVWKIDSEDDLEKAVLALVSNQDRFDTIDVVVLKESALTKYELNIIDSPGNTPVKSLVEAHKDIVELSFSGIGVIKDHIVERILDQHTKRFTVGTLKKLVKKSIEEGLLNKDDLKESIRGKI